MNEYWVQIEMPPDGKTTACIQFNIAAIDRIIISFEPDGVTPNGVDATYTSNNTMQRFQLGERNSAQEFLKAWGEYSQSIERKMEYTSPRREPGLIEVPKSGQSTIPAGVSIR